MTDGKANEGDTDGEEVNNDTPNVPQTSNEPSPLEEADRINKEKATLLEREEKLQDRKEKLFAEEKVGGRAKTGITQTFSPEDNKKNNASEFFKGTALGDAIDKA